MKIILYNLVKTQKNLLKAKEVFCVTQSNKRFFNDLSLRASFIRQHSDNRILSKKLLLSPAEATQTLRTNEATVDVESTCAIKYYDVNYLGSNMPPEDRSAQAKLLNSDIFLFGVFDGLVTKISYLYYLSGKM